MNKSLTALSLAGFFAAAGCAKTIDTATCRVNVSDPENIMATVTSNVTGATILKASNFLHTKEGNMRAMSENITGDYDYSGYTLDVDLNTDTPQCRLDAGIYHPEHDLIYPAVLVKDENIPANEA